MGEEAPNQPDQAPMGFGRLLLNRLERVYSGSTVLFWPFTDIVMRFFVALSYFRSGMVKASNWDTAVLLASEEYPVSWMVPNTAAATGLVIELIAPVLLVLGLCTRPAAFALAALTVISQIVYIPTTTNLMLIAMLLWYVIYGPAALSLDTIWARRVQPSVMSMVAAALRVGAWSRRTIAPYLVLAMRVWLGLALLALAGWIEPPIAVQTWLPITAFTGLPSWIAALFAFLLITGTAASPVSYALALVVAAFMIVGVHPDVTFYPVLLLGVYESRGAGPLSVDNAVDRWFRGRFMIKREEADIDDPETWFALVKASFHSSKAIAGQARDKLRERAEKA